MLKLNSLIELIPLWPNCQVPFFTDSPFYEEKIPQEFKSSSLREFFTHRHKLKEFCLKNKIQSPSYFCSDRFDKLAAWAVSRNKFPMVIKTAQNLSDGNGMYILKAFRELPEFHEILASATSGQLLIEEFVQAKGYIEVTVIGGRIALVAQLSFEKSMRLRHSWRAFPVKLPHTILTQVKTIIGKFPLIADLQHTPLRFTFALTSPEITLLSANSGINRPEYNPVWTEAAGTDNIFSKKSADDMRICKLLNFYEVKETDVCWPEIERLCDKSLAKYALIEDQAIVLLSCNDASPLLDYAKRVNAYFKHISQTNAPDRPGDED